MHRTIRKTLRVHARAAVAAGAIAAALAIPLGASAQDSVRAWYADGQVWVVWHTTPPDPVTYGIYAGAAAFTNTADAALIGRTFAEEWMGGRLKHNASDSTITYTIPDTTGGTYTLAADEGLFVETVHASGAKYYAVAKWGDTDVTNSVTASAVDFTYSPGVDPPECQPQLSDTTSTGYPYTIYCMWADGRDDQDSGRPDFPVMANFAKNGAPHVVKVSEPIGGPGTAPHPAVWFLHGGEGSAKGSSPDDREEIDLRITQGYLVAHDDHLVRDATNDPFVNQNTWFFGWRKNFDPFVPPVDPAPGDTVINYTQRRFLWINEWMIRRLDVDRRRVSIMGHSVGSSGTNQMAKAYPNTFATACTFNNGLGGPNGVHPLFGDATTNLATNLVNRDGETVQMADVWDMTTNISLERDLALTRVFHGKQDQNGTMLWDSLVVANYREADAEGWGIHLYWDERGHGLETWDSYWSHGVAPDSQTARDDVAYQMRYRSNQSYPAFYNLQFQPESADPGNGVPTDGDAWGTWGGWHDWELDTIVDQEDRWGVTAILVGDSAVGGTGSPVDSCPFDSLTSDLAIRKPQSFLPGPGAAVHWHVVRLSDGDTLQSGIASIASDSLVTATGVTLYREPDRVRIVFVVAGATAVGGPGLEGVAGPVATRITSISPNPAGGPAVVRYALDRSGPVQLVLFDVQGRLVRTLVDARGAAGDNAVAWDGRDAGGRLVGAGVYVVRLQAGDRVDSRKLTAMR